MITFDFFKKPSLVLLIATLSSLSAHAIKINGELGDGVGPAVSSVRFIKGFIHVYGELAESVWNSLDGDNTDQARAKIVGSSENSLSWLPGVAGGPDKEADPIQYKMIKGIECTLELSRPTECRISTGKNADRYLVETQDNGPSGIANMVDGGLIYHGPAAEMTWNALGGETLEESRQKVASAKTGIRGWFSGYAALPRKEGRAIVCQITEPNAEVYCQFKFDKRGLSFEGLWLPPDL